MISASRRIFLHLKSPSFAVYIVFRLAANRLEGTREPLGFLLERKFLRVLSVTVTVPGSSFFAVLAAALSSLSNNLFLSFPASVFFAAPPLRNFKQGLAVFPGREDDRSFSPRWVIFALSLPPLLQTRPRFSAHTLLIFERRFVRIRQSTKLPRVPLLITPPLAEHFRLQRPASIPSLFGAITAPLFFLVPLCPH